MSDEQKSFGSKFWPLRLFMWLMLVAALVLFVVFFVLQHGENWAKPWLLRLAAGSALLFLLASVGALLSLISQTRFLAQWISRRWFFCAAVIATLIALFYAGENWRGRRAWEQCKRDSLARGIELDWAKFIPPPVPDDQNVYKAPKMREWFVRVSTSGGLSSSSDFGRQLSSNKLTLTNITNAIEARDYLDWSKQFDSQFGLIRDALQRPYARFDTDYAEPSTMDIPAFVTIRSVVRVLAQRAKCELLLSQPEAAVHDLTLIHDMTHFLDGKPTGKPITLVAAMINVAISGPYVESVGLGLQTKAWPEPQLVALEKQLTEMRLEPLVEEAFRGEQVFSPRMLEATPRAQLTKTFGTFFGSPGERTWFQHLQNPEIWFIALAPRGWLYQNMAIRANLTEKYFDCIDASNEVVWPSRENEMARTMETTFRRSSPYVLLAASLTPNFRRAIQVMARNQTTVNEARLACALERYRTAHGEYPDSLDLLAPQFIETIPHDIIDGEPLKYRRNQDGYLLYSVGWNKKDDGGVFTLNKEGAQDVDTGDWVWSYAAK